MVINMRTVQMTLDDDLVASVDQIVKQLRTSRSSFTRQALKEAVRQFARRELEEKHRSGYARKPIAEDEFSFWENEQKWSDE